MLKINNVRRNIFKIKNKIFKITAFHPEKLLIFSKVTKKS